MGLLLCQLLGRWLWQEGGGGVAMLFSAVFVGRLQEMCEGWGPRPRGCGTLSS